MKTVMEFSFYLDAWLYCRKHSIDMTNIEKKNFRTWLLHVDQEIPEGSL